MAQTVNLTDIESMAVEPIYNNVVNAQAIVDTYTQRLADAQASLTAFQSSLSTYESKALTAHGVTPPGGSTIAVQKNGDGTISLVITP